MALKGGTALNLFVLDLPRLSVDIDLNYVGSADREEMLAVRPRLEQALEQVFGRAGLTVRRIPDSHAGGKWRLTYTSALGRPGNIEVDLNDMLRTPLWPLLERDSHVLDGQGARRVLLLDGHELEFLERLNGHGEIVPSLLTGEPELQEILASHPGLKWKAQNVKQHVAGSERPLR